MAPSVSHKSSTCALPGTLLGTAGWSVPRDLQAHFPDEGTTLERYSRRFPAVEINSTFYRPHRASTYERWRTSVPSTFRFAIKIPKTITHGQRLVDSIGLLDTFLGESAALGPKLGCLLVQLPPSLQFDDATASAFFAALRERTSAGVACEPRHASWFEPAVDARLAESQIARVAADPARVPLAAVPSGWMGMRYYRLHGSPRIYYSSYEPYYLQALAADIASAATARRRVWCIFDSTVLGAAATNALAIDTLLRQAR